MCFARGSLRAGVTLLMLGQLLGLLLPAMSARGAWAATPTLVQAREAYRDGEFAACVRALDSVLAAGGLTAAELQQAYELQARAHVQLGNADLARAAFKQLLDLDPAWRPDEDVVRPNEVALFREVLAARAAPATGATTTQAVPSPPAAAKAAQLPAAEVRKERKPSRAWWYLGGLGLVAGLAVALGGGGGGGGGGGTDGGGATALPGAPPPPPGH